MEHKAINITNIGGLLAGIAFLALPYISVSLGLFGNYNYTALQVVQIGNGLHGSDTGFLWLELLIALVVVILAILAWKPSIREHRGWH